jgi:hypothetical protein
MELESIPSKQVINWLNLSWTGDNKPLLELALAVNKILCN